jgi:putative glutamine amidotransferase
MIAAGAPIGRIVVSAATEARAVPYLAALAAAGLPPDALLVVTPETITATDFVDSLFAAPAARSVAGAGIAGLVLCGGADVAPERYGEAPAAGAGLHVVAERDDLEWRLLGAARESRVPVWGVCRGFQLLNVFLGGSLWQDLPMQRPGAAAHDREVPPDLLAHAVEVVEPLAPLGRHLARPLAHGGGAPLVNSRHHQGIKRLAPGLLAVAAAPDGLIEAAVGLDGDGDVDGDAAWWVRGVQWHPENLLALPEQLELWRDFASAATGSTVTADRA